MGTFKLACHLIQFRGEQHEHPEKVLAEVAEAGWDGVEGLRIEHADDLVDKANLAKSHGLHLVNVGGPTPRDRIRYNIALGNEAAEVPSLRRAAWGGDEPSDADIETAARTLDDLLAYCAAHHVKGFHHAHMRTLIETVEDAEKLMTAAPDLWLLYDTGHLLASGSDPMRVFDSAVLRDRIGHVHLKDVHADAPQHGTTALGSLTQKRDSQNSARATSALTQKPHWKNSKLSAMTAGYPSNSTAPIHPNPQQKRQNPTASTCEAWGTEAFYHHTA